MTELDYMQILWNYLNYDQQLEKSDCILIFGSQDLEVAKRGAELYLQDYAPLIIITGGLGRNTEGLFKKSEAEIFAEICADMGVPRNRILIETKSTNTGENISFTKQLLQDRNITTDRIIAVHQPYMGRRIYAALKKQWEEQQFIITSPQLTLQQYIEDVDQIGITKEDLFNTIVGDFERMDTYAKCGFQIPQEIPNEVNEAYNRIVELGYNKQLSK